MCNKKKRTNIRDHSILIENLINLQMSFFAEAARSCASRSPSGQCETPETTERVTFMGYVKQFIASIEVWHLNVFSTVVVLVFVYLQFRSMFISRPRPKQLKQESFNQKTTKQKEFADKQVS